MPLRAVIEQYRSDEKDDWGNVKWQYAWAKVAYKAQDGKCYVIRVTVIQDYKGSGKYGATRFYARYNSSGDYEIKLENVNK